MVQGEVADLACGQPVWYLALFMVPKVSHTVVITKRTIPPK